MKRLAVAKICGGLLFGALSLSVSAATGQYFDTGPAASSPQQNNVRRPLNQLPPIVSSQQAQQKVTQSPSAAKNPYPSSNVSNLPPIVTPGQRQQSQPNIVGKQNSPPIIQNVPPIVQKNQSGLMPNTNPVPQNLPAIVQPGNPSRKTIPNAGLNPVFPQKSAAGIPIYPSSSTRINNQPGSGMGPVNPVPVVRGGGSRNPASGGETRNLTPLPSTPTIPSSNTKQETASSLSPGDLPALPDIEIDEPDSVMESDIANSGTTIVESPVPANTPGTNNFFDQSVPGSPVDNGCADCGPGGCYDPNMVQAQNGCCGSVSSAGYYLFADALFWTRSDGEVQLSNFFGLNDFNFVGGARFTLGFRDNSTEGRELTYFGTGDLDESETVNNAAGALQPLFGIDASLSVPTGFINAVTHTQAKESQLHSLEYNRISWGWDLLKTFIGVRYIYFDDSYSFFGTNIAGTNALFTMDSVNNLFGVHTGFELFYDVGYRTSTSFTSKFGGYVNAANVDTNLFNFGTQILNQETDDSSIASTIEFNFMSHFQLSPRSRFRFGYDIFLGWGLFTIQNNIPRDTFARGFSTGSVDLSPNTGTNLNTNNEPLFFHGPSVGFEVFR